MSPGTWALQIAMGENSAVDRIVPRVGPSQHFDQLVVNFLQKKSSKQEAKKTSLLKCGYGPTLGTIRLDLLLRIGRFQFKRVWRSTVQKVVAFR